MDYEQYAIKEYKHWVVYLHPDQSYLGRVYVWAKRENALDFFEMTLQENEELFFIVSQLKTALRTAFSPDHYNYAALANEARHMHLHIIPRYKKTRTFNRVIFRDTRWGKNYVPHEATSLEENIIMKIKETIEEKLQSL